MRTTPSLYRHKNKNVTRQMLGIKLETSDVLHEFLAYKKNLNIDDDLRVPLKDTPFNSSEVTIMIDHDFTQRYYEVYYFGVTDIMAIIGGLNASIGPLLKSLAPLFILNYLWALSEIIRHKHQEKYHRNLMHLYLDYGRLLNQMSLPMLESLDNK